MHLPPFNPMTASASVISDTKSVSPEYSTMQDELWSYYFGLEEFCSAVTWKANALSRIRLIGAKKLPGIDEPVPLPPDDPAVQAIERLAGGIGGQSQLMREMGVHFNVAGEGWLVGFIDVFGQERWDVFSADELEVKRSKDGLKEYFIRVGDGQRDWEPLGQDSVVVRFWRPNERFGWKATSVAQHALGAMKELDLINKRIVAELLSRMASNGVILYDKDKLSFPDNANPSSAESIDPFAQTLVDVGSRAMRDQWSPEASIKIPIGASLGDATDVKLSDLIHVVDLSNVVSDRLLELRDSAIRRIATVMDMPSDILLGVGGMNHWGAAQIEESGIKLHISPDAELEVHSLTIGYLYPMLEAIDVPIVDPEDGGRRIIWYDPSDIVQRPDKSANAIQAYDRFEISGDALRRETGFAEGDKPTSDEVDEMATKLRLRTQRRSTSTEVIEDETTNGTNGDTSVGDSVSSGESSENPSDATSGAVPNTDVSDSAPSEV